MNKQNKRQNQTVLNEELLLKHGLQLTVQQVADASDGEVVNGCLILKKEIYDALAFLNRNDFVAILALSLRKVPANMFYGAKNLKTVLMLEVEEICGGDFNTGAFALAGVENCCFPKLQRVGAYAFQKCAVTTLDEDNFPALKQVGDNSFAECGIKALSLPFLEQIGKHSFSDCRFASVDLPSLLSIGAKSFRGCQYLKQFSAKKLQRVGAGCFTSCPLLSSINCDLQPEKFTCDKCQGCPVCYHDVEACLQRGRSGKQEKDCEIDQQALNQVLQKYKVDVTVQQALDAEEGKVINGCLVLKEEHYRPGAFKDRKDFTSVFAVRLRHVAYVMFYEATTLTTLIMPEAVGVMFSSFYNTHLKDCFFPKLVEIQNSAFQLCQIKQLTTHSFPVLEAIGNWAFSDCPISLVNLPSLLSVGKEAFKCGPDLRRFSASKLQEIGPQCFAKCPQLSSIDCDLEPERFVCKDRLNLGCGECLVCRGDLLQCLRRGTAPRQLGQVQRGQSELLCSRFKLLDYQLNEKDRIRTVEPEVQMLERKLEHELECGLQ